MNWINTTFWIAYGIARNDLVIFVPNAIGFLLGMAQGMLCFYFPTSKSPTPSTTTTLVLDRDVAVKDEDEVAVCNISIQAIDKSNQRTISSLEVI